MKIKIKRLTENSVIPKYAKSGDAGLDLVATSLVMDEKGNAVYGTGLAFEIPDGYVGLLFPRSSICNKNQSLTNAVGVIDSGYRGEVSMKFKPSEVYLDNLSTNDVIWHPKKDNQHEIVGETMYKVGDKIGQLIIIPYPKVEFEEVKELSETDRGTGGYGSTGS